MAENTKGDAQMKALLNSGGICPCCGTPIRLTDPEALRVLTDIACSGGLLVGSELAMIFLGPGNKATDSKGEQKEGGDG